MSTSTTDQKHTAIKKVHPTPWQTTVACSCGWTRTVFGKLNKNTYDYMQSEHQRYAAEDRAA